MVNIFLTFSSFSGWRLRFEDLPPPPPRRTSATDIRANVSLSFFLLLSLSLFLSLSIDAFQLRFKPNWLMFDVRQSWLTVCLVSVSAFNIISFYFCITWMLNELSEIDLSFDRVFNFIFWFRISWLRRRDAFLIFLNKLNNNLIHFVSLLFRWSKLNQLISDWIRFSFPIQAIRCF